MRTLRYSTSRWTMKIWPALIHLIVAMTVLYSGTRYTLNKVRRAWVDEDGMSNRTVSALIHVHRIITMTGLVGSYIEGSGRRSRSTKAYQEEQLTYLYLSTCTYSNA